MMQRPPSKEEIKEFLERFDATTPNSAHWTHADMDFMVRAYRYLESVAQGHVEDLRDAGRELREMQSEIANLERQVVTW